MTDNIVQKVRKAPEGVTQGALVARLADEVERLRFEIADLEADRYVGFCNRMAMHDLRAEWDAACCSRDRLHEAVDRVRALHVCTHPIRDSIDDPCVQPRDSCGERLPCSTIRALDGEAQQ